jgi:hypothetical protein
MSSKISLKYDVVVAGGGLAGFCAAVAAARNGANTCIVQNRPVFGGNSSSEIRVTPHGACAFHAYARETGIISELLIAERAANHEEIFENGWTNSVWDLTMYNMVQATPNLTAYLNANVEEVIVQPDQRIKSIRAIVQNAETKLDIEGEIFIDCTGDGLIAHLAGCEWRMGTEGRSEFNEPHAPEKASNDVMGNSIHFKTKNVGKPVPFIAPNWARKYDDAGFFYKQGRLPKEERGGYWWIEIGVPFNTITDNEAIRHELTRHALGVWDWMKNKDPRMKVITENYALDWIGQVPGKRESRRIMGEYLMTEHDPQNCTAFYDEIAFGGWFIDLHTPGGLLAHHSEPASNENYSTFSEYAVKSYAGPYGIPLRCLIAKDVENLMMAGRNVSVTHAALGTVRVMNTCALMGQAAGTCAALCVENGIPLKNAPQQLIKTIQQTLLRNGCFLLNQKNEDPLDVALKAKVTASSESLMYGAEPDSPFFSNGLKVWRDQPQYQNECLETVHGQLIAVASSKLEWIELLLENLSNEPQQVAVSLKKVQHIWDYRLAGNFEMAATWLEVEPGKHWVRWVLEMDIEPGTFIRIDAGPNNKVLWHTASCIIPGHMSMYQISTDRMRRFGNGHTLSFRVSPSQACFGPNNIQSGVTRPYAYTNLWKSDEKANLPQWIELAWKDKQTIKTVECTFPGHLLREYHAYDPFYRDPQCPADYSIECLENEKWIPVVSIEGNFQRHRVHHFSFPVSTNKLRLVIYATNGDPSAQVYEIRCY